MKSRRGDGRGHWRRGRRRNDPGVPEAELKAIRRRLRAIGRRSGRGPLSLRAIARKLGVDNRSVRRWASGQHTPAATRVARLKTILD